MNVRTLSSASLLSLLTAGFLGAQAPVALTDRQEILLEGRLFRRTGLERSYAAISDLPEFRSGLATMKHSELAWDGAKLYQFGFNDVKKASLRMGIPMFSGAGDRRWFWTDSRFLPLPEGHSYAILGAWEDSLLFLQTTRVTSADNRIIPDPKGKDVSQHLLRMDLLTGEARVLAKLQTGRDGRTTTVFSQDAFYLFTAAGRLIRINVRVEPWTVDVLKSDIWNEAGIKLCKDTGEFRNPCVLGRAFFDSDGSILVPAQVLLPLDRADIDSAWSKLPQDRKAELIRTGFWPVPIDQEVGWKDEVFFLRFDPSTSQLKLADPSSYRHLTVEEDRHFQVRRFKVVDPTVVYGTIDGRIQPMQEILQVVDLQPVLESKPARGVSPVQGVHSVSKTGKGPGQAKPSR